MNKLSATELQTTIAALLAGSAKMGENETDPIGQVLRREADRTASLLLTNKLDAVNTPEILHNPAMPLVLIWAAGQLALKQGWTPAQFVELTNNAAGIFDLLDE